MGSFCSLGCDKDKTTRMRSYNSIDEILFSTGLFVQENRESFTSIYDIFPKSIGYGAYGEVFICEHKRSKEIRAVKIIDKNLLSKGMIEKRKVLNEVDILRTLDHPNVLKVFEYFEDPRNYYLVMEYCSGGDLFDELDRVKSFDEISASKIMSQILAGVAYIHNQSIVHRDLKLENILIWSKANEIHIKIIDFNIATINTGKKLSKFTGTSYYIAPEVINESYDEKCDVWSCGVIMFLLLTGSFPFIGSTRDAVLHNIKANKITFYYKTWNKVSSEAQDLIRLLLNQNPGLRISAVEALKHPWIESVFEQQVDQPFFERTITRMLSVQKKPKLKEMFETFLLGQVQKNDSRISVYEKVFLDFDADRNGVINKEDIILRLRNQIEPDLVLKEAERLMKIIDNDKSGAIDFTEFLRCALEEDIFICKENLHKAFCYFDKNRSDSIEKTELMAWLAEGAIIPMNVIEELIEEADKNHDGEIDLAEFEDLLLERINKEDHSSNTSFDSLNE